MLMTSEGTMIRMAVCEIPVYKRSAGGVIVMRTSGEAKVATFTVVVSEEEIEVEGAEASAEASTEAPVVTE